MQQLIVWCQALRPRFRLLDHAEFAVLAQLAAGARLGAVSTALEQRDFDAAQLGEWLAHWLGEGLLSASSVLT